MENRRMSGTRDSRTRAHTPIAAALGALLCAAAVALPAEAERGVDQTIQVSYTGLGAERVKTVPIAKNSGAKTRVAMSLPPEKVGIVGQNDSVWAGAEIEVSVTCLEPMPKCVGKVYHYSPHVKARLVLAGSPKASGKRNTTPIGKPKHLRCSQELPNRNHHCVLALNGRRNLAGAENLPCDRCHVNLLLDAYHPKAKRGQVIVVGTDQDHRISQDKGTLNAAVYDPGPPPAISPVVSRRRSKKKLPVAAQHSSGRKEVVVISRRLNELKAGEQLLIDADVKVKTGHLGYGALLQSQIILSEKAGSIKRKGTPGKIASGKGVVTAQNGFNCTRGKSGHRSPCTVRKFGAVKIFKDARTRPEQGEGAFVPLFANLVMSSKAEFGGHRHRPGDFAKIVKGSKLSVTRYGPEYRR
jgi:hypothetical protein